MLFNLRGSRVNATKMQMYSDEKRSEVQCSWEWYIVAFFLVELSVVCVWYCKTCYNTLLFLRFIVIQLIAVSFTRWIIQKCLARDVGVTSAFLVRKC